MMKKLIAMLLILATVFSLVACTPAVQDGPQSTTAPETTAPEVTEPITPAFSVYKPMAYPDYTFDHTPTTDELRQMAVKAMLDYLSVQWYTDTEISYNKTGAVSGKDFKHKVNTVYAGLPYTNGDAGLIHFMDFYENETGKLLFDGSDAEFNQLIGGTCACGVMWSWATVCDSLNGTFVNHNMVYKYGCYPVGNYTYDYEKVSSYEFDMSTREIRNLNGKTVMFQSYAQVLPADGLVQTGHATMAIEPAHVVYNADGSINGAKSYIIIADQRAGTDGDGEFYKVNEGGKVVLYSGRTYYKMTFNTLYNLSYLPVTTAEFSGREEYVVPQVKVSNDPKSLSELMKSTITCNYIMCILKVQLVDERGKVTQVVSRHYDKVDVRTGKAKKIPMSDFTVELRQSELNKLMESGKTYTLRVQVTTSNGESFIAAQVPVSKT